MKNADMPAMPIIDDKVSTHDTEIFHGLTKREHFAAMAMQGLLARGYSDLRGRMAGEQRLSNEAIKIADALLEELSK